jgi:hypothetical protein
MTDLASRIVKAMTALGYTVDRGPGEKNIVYVEGMNVDGSLNDNKPNRFNDVRCVIEFKDGKPAITGIWQATSEPGKRYTEQPLPGVEGAARIKFGQYRAWQVGIHHAGKPSAHEALVQSRTVTVCRDVNRDYRRDGDPQTTGIYGINQHWGYDLPESDVGSSSAGCLVGRTKEGHREFMALVKTDPRYLADPKHVFASAILPADAVLAGAVGVTPKSATQNPDARQPASIRYKNPGAMWGSAHAEKWGAINGGKGVPLADGTGQGNTIAQFPTFVAGIAAQIALWRTSRYRNKKFKEAIIPWSGGNNVPSYIALVAKHVPGFTGDTVIDDALLQGPSGIPFLKAQAWHEAGKEYPAPDADWIEARRLVFGGAPPVSTAGKVVAVTVGVGTGTAAAASQGFDWLAIGLTGFIVGGLALAVVVLIRKFRS